MRKRKLSRKIGQRKALLRSLVRELILKEKIQTTEAKAKEVFHLAQKLIEKAKKENEGQRRTLLKYVFGEALTKLIFELAPRYQERKGGYLRIIKLGQRKSDGAKMAQIEFLK